MTTYFANKFGFTANETVALMGAHTLGAMHPNASGFTVIFYLYIIYLFSKLMKVTIATFYFYLM